MMRRRNTPAEETNQQATTRSFLKSEWPLFLYPALVVAALVLLQAVHQSIEKDLTPSQRPPDPSASQTTAATEQNDQNTSQARLPQDGSTLPPDALAPLPDTGETDTTLAADPGAPGRIEAPGASPAAGTGHRNSRPSTPYSRRCARRSGTRTMPESKKPWSNWWRWATRWWDH